MTTVILVIHILLALALIGVVLLQRSEGGGLGIGGGGGGGGGGMGGFLTGRGTANLLTRTTAILAAGFMVTSLALTMLAGRDEPRSLLDRLPGSAPAQSVPGEAVPSPAPAAPSEPSVPTQ
jgi:preprotein translocase subunit SecG